MWLYGRGTLNCYRLASAPCFQTLQTLKYDNLLTTAPYLRHKHENGIKGFICLLAKEENSAFTKMSKCSWRGWRRWLRGRRGFFFSPLRCPEGSRKQWGSVYSQPQSKSSDRKRLIFFSLQGIGLQILGQAGLYTHTHTLKRPLGAHASGWCHSGRSTTDELSTSIMFRLI